jgi:hypothetical protein
MSFFHCLLNVKINGTFEKERKGLSSVSSFEDSEVPAGLRRLKKGLRGSSST